MYNWDLNKILKRYVYRNWRKPRFLAFMYSLGSPLNYVFSMFSQWRNNLNWKLKFRFQVIYLEHYLNNHYALPYDVSTRDQDIANESIISVQTTEFLPDNYVFFQNEERNGLDTYFVSENEPEPVLYFDSEYQVATHFTIKVPASVQYDDKVMRRLIEFYLQAGKRFKIEYY